MKSNAVLIGICLFVLGCAAFFSYFEKGGVIRYNNQIVDQVIQSDARFEGVFELFNLYIEGSGQIEISSLRDRIKELREGVEGDLEAYEAMKLKGGASGEAFYEGGLRYLMVSMAYVDGMDQFLGYATKNPEDVEGQRAFWSEMSNVLEARSDEAMVEYLERQRTFADLHGFELNVESN